MKASDVLQENVWNVSNALSILRIVLLGPFFMLVGAYVAAPANTIVFSWLLAVIGLSIVSDFLDGFLARLLHQETRLGRYLDPVADKLTTISALGVITWFFDFPPLIFFLIVLREIVGVWGGTFLYYKRNMQGKPNIWGKLGVTLTALSVLWYISLPWLQANWQASYPDWWRHPEFLAWTLLLTVLIGVLQYGRSYWGIVFGSASRQFNQPKEQPPAEKPGEP
ncbi:MAG: CDP-alcohol phosphatidyltransferase family protein [Leptospiraceae bacterium]|nr:CDP-alcohol phosphatidyltransferase family protein [Leptospiraceae bacterium]